MLIEQIQESIKNNTPLFIKGYMDYNLNWGDIVNIISDAYNSPVGAPVEEGYESHNSSFNPRLKKFTKLKAAANNGLIFHAEDVLDGQLYPIPDKYINIQKLKDDALLVEEGNQVIVKFAINLTAGSPPLFPHRDTHHVLLTQVIGSVKYIIHESIESDPYQSYIDVTGRKFTEYDMEKNDILFMPYGTIHSIDNSTTRVACILDIGKFT